MFAPFKILRLGHPALRRVATPFTREEILSPQTRKLVHDMKKQMVHSNGVGLAAPQIGISKQLVVMGIEEEVPEIDTFPTFAMFNPKLEFILKHETIFMLESCLSLPDFIGKVPRYNNVIVSYMDENGTAKKIGATGYIAGVIQHETDHLQGNLFIDKLKSTKDLAYREEFEQYHNNDSSLCWKGSIKFYDDESIEN